MTFAALRGSKHIGPRIKKFQTLLKSKKLKKLWKRLNPLFPQYEAIYINTAIDIRLRTVTK